MTTVSRFASAGPVASDTDTGRKRGPTARALAAALVGGAMLAGVSVAALAPWAGGVYHAHGTGVWPKNAVTLEVSPGGTTVPMYSFSIDTLCGKDNVGGRETYVWPFNSVGSPALVVRTSGAFTSTQRGQFMVPPIPTLTTRREPGSYRFSVSGVFKNGGAVISGHLSLEIQTTNGYFCTDTNSPFSGGRSKG